MLLFRYQTGFENIMQVSDFFFDYVNSLDRKCQKINLKRDRSYIEK